MSEPTTTEARTERVDAAPTTQQEPTPSQARIETTARRRPIPVTCDCR